MTGKRLSEISNSLIQMHQSKKYEPIADQKLFDKISDLTANLNEIVKKFMKLKKYKKNINVDDPIFLVKPQFLVLPFWPQNRYELPYLHRLTFHKLESGVSNFPCLHL